MPPPVEVALRIVADDQAQAVVARTERSIGQLGASNARLGVSGQAAAAGLSKASNAITNLAGDALGANNKVANLVEGLLSFGVGATVVTAVAAGLAIITTALFYFSKESRDAQKAWDDYLATLQKTTPLAQVGKAMDDILERVQARPVTALDYTKQFLGWLGITQSRDELLREAGTIVQAYHGLFESLHEEAVKGGKKVSVAAARAQEEI